MDAQSNSQPYNELASRGCWNTKAVGQHAMGFYKFNVHGVHLDKLSYSRMRECDPGLPDWETFLRLLEESQLNPPVHS
jgi:hypothetical protein